MTSSFTNLVMAGFGLGNWADLAHFEVAIQGLTEAWSRLFAPADLLTEQLAARRFSRVQYLGSGPLRAVACESALKAVELTAGRVVSSGDSFLGARHGSLATLNDRALVVAFLSSTPHTRRQEVEVLREIRHARRAAEMVVLAQDPGPELRQLGAFLLNVETPDRMATDYLAPVVVLFGQLFGLHSAIAHGVRADDPSESSLEKVTAPREMSAV